MRLLDGINDTEDELYTFDSIMEIKTTSEGLEALESLSLDILIDNEQQAQRVIKNKEIIKKELKRLYALEKMYNHALEVNSKLSESIVKYKKKDKALEIVKNKKVDIRSLDNIICLCATDESALKEYNRCCGKDEEDNDISLTQEEYDLLKEVLL